MVITQQSQEISINKFETFTDVDVAALVNVAFLFSANYENVLTGLKRWIPVTVIESILTNVYRFLYVFLPPVIFVPYTN